MFWKLPKDVRDSKEHDKQWTSQQSGRNYTKN